MIDQAIGMATAGTSPVRYRVTGLRTIGKGVAFAISSPGLMTLRSQLASHFNTWLTPQDRARFWPHITIQNKVAPQTAKALHAGLAAGFTPFESVSPGLDLWRYLGGPWRHERFFAFQTELG